MEINLDIFYKKCAINMNNKLKKENLLMAKFVSYCKYLNFKLNEVILIDKINELNKILLYKISYYPLDSFGCLYVMNKITSDQICCILFKIKYEEIDISSILDIASKYLELIQLTNIPEENYVFDEDIYDELIDPDIVIDDIIIQSFLTPRNMVIMKIIDYLYDYYDEFNYDIDNIINIAKNIEKSCYNSTIANCRQSDTPPPRNWESLEFLETYYSPKCGLVLRLLHKNSQSVKEYGRCLINQIISQSIVIEKIGFMSESELCPIAQEREKNDIAIRMMQKIKHKYSELYKCPSCHQNKSTPLTKQLRGADEESDVICTCICGFKFKIK